MLDGEEIGIIQENRFLDEIYQKVLDEIEDMDVASWEEKEGEESSVVSGTLELTALMDAYAHWDGDEISVLNIGRIKAAKIKLRGMTVVARYNGNGKSTISKALYALMDINGSIKGKAMLQRMRSLDQLINQWQRTFVPLGGEDFQDADRFRREVRTAGRFRPMAPEALEKELYLIAEGCGFTDLGKKDIAELAEGISEIQKRIYPITHAMLWRKY